MLIIQLSQDNPTCIILSDIYCLLSAIIIIVTDLFHLKLGTYFHCAFLNKIICVGSELVRLKDLFALYSQILKKLPKQAFKILLVDKISGGNVICFL